MNGTARPQWTAKVSHNAAFWSTGISSVAQNGEIAGKDDREFLELGGCLSQAPFLQGNILSTRRSVN
jgi:hypothetical protein